MFQTIWILLSLTIGYLLSKQPEKWFDEFTTKYSSTQWYIPLLKATKEIIYPSISIILLMMYLVIGSNWNLQYNIVDVIITLVGAWIIIRFCSFFIDHPKLSKWFAIITWSIAALNILGILEILIEQLDSISLHIGESKVSILSLASGLIIFALFIWGATVLSRLIEGRLRKIPEITPSLQVLLSKVIRITLIALAFVIGLNTLGIDLTALAVFSGAVGVGLGFGLQKVVSNFISGIILLMDRSIKPGDVIFIDGTYGWVNTMKARYVSIITRDGKEHLIPNELLITEKVENWSYSDSNVRLRIPLSISYDSDPRKALELVMEASKETPRVLDNPGPKCQILGFGDSSVNLEVRLWINDPPNGLGSIRTDVLLRVWDKFHEHGIKIPYPQRDIHIKTVPEKDFFGKA